jgi:hypothetical protein
VAELDEQFGMERLGAIEQAVLMPIWSSSRRICDSASSAAR